MTEKSVVLFVSFFLIFVFSSKQLLKAQDTASNSFTVIETTELEGEIFDISKSQVIINNDGDFIVVDHASNRLLIFSSDGEFLKSMGRTGRGPGEFVYLKHARQLSSGNYLAADMLGRLSLFSPAGELVRSYVVPIVRTLVSFIEIDENTILIPGMINEDNSSKLLHKLDLQSGDIVNSFFESPFQLGDFGGILGNIESMVRAVTDGEFIYAFITFSNEMHIFDYDGNYINSTKIDYEHFSILEEQENILSREEILELAVSHSLITDIIWKGDSTLIVRYWKFTQLEPPSGIGRGSMDRYSSFAEIDLQGNILFEEENTPKILDFDKTSNHYILRDSLSLDSDVQRILKAQRN